MSDLLELDHVSAAYGKFRAVFDVSFSVPEGHAVALLGPNGAGKSTIARVCTGLIPVSSGAVRFDGKDITELSTWQLSRLGIAHAPEGRSVFGTLTVEENLTLPFRRLLGKAGVAAAIARAYSAFPRLGERRKQIAGTLSGGEQRMLSLAKVLAAPPRLLVVDELSLGLAPIVVDEVFATLARIREAGTSLLIVEQHVGKALSLADRAVLLTKGSVTYEGRVDELGDQIGQLLPGGSAGTGQGTGQGAG